MTIIVPEPFYGIGVGVIVFFIGFIFGMCAHFYIFQQEMEEHYKKIMGMQRNFLDKMEKHK